MPFRDTGISTASIFTYFVGTATYATALGISAEPIEAPTIRRSSCYEPYVPLNGSQLNKFVKALSPRILAVSRLISFPFSDVMGFWECEPCFKTDPDGSVPATLSSTINIPMLVSRGAKVIPALRTESSHGTFEHMYTVSRI